jgi:hypothetical protein
LSKDYERKVQSSEAFVEVAMIRLMLQRLAKGSINLTNDAFRQPGEQGSREA